MKKDIRFLLTQRCNYDCFFCHGEGVIECPSQQELTVDEYLTLYQMYSQLEEWNGVTLSGGEPLIYKDILLLTKALYDCGAKITVVTNGSLLLQNMPALKYVDRINVSIHTLDEVIYESITKRKLLPKVIQGLKQVREMYPQLKIRLNITPTRNTGWSEMRLKDLIEFAKIIDASIKLTELFPQNDLNCVTLEELKESVKRFGYTEKSVEGRNCVLEHEGQQIFLTQCTCSKAMEYDDPVMYCRETHDLYVNHTAHFMLCRLTDIGLDFFEDIRNGDLETLRYKMCIALKRVSSQKCKREILSKL